MIYGLAAIIVLGVGAQWLGWRLRLPSILLLLLFGFLAGPIALWATDGKFGLNPVEIFGDPNAADGADGVGHGGGADLLDGDRDDGLSDGHDGATGVALPGDGREVADDASVFADPGDAPDAVADDPAGAADGHGNADGHGDGHGHGDSHGGGGLLLSLVSLAVGLILFEGGLTLTFREIQNVRKAVFSLVTVGAVITWVVVSVAARYLLGLNWPVAILLGAVLIVTGPTVIGPLLRFVRPTGSVGKVLKWEGIVIDPIGAMVAVLVFEAVLAGFSPDASGIGDFIWGVVKTAGAGTIIGIALGAALTWMMKHYWIPDHLQTPVALMFAAIAFVAANAVVYEGGLYSTTVMGIWLANQKSAHIRHIVEFKETLVTLLIAALFIVLSARLELSTLRAVGENIPGLIGFIAVVVLVARPAAVFASTLGSTLTNKDKLFLSWMAPRGIVAAAVASVFGLGLEEAGVEGAELIVPYTFVVIVVTVAIYGLTASLVAKKLGLARPGSAGFLIVGSHPLARQIGLALQKEEIETLLVDTNYLNVQQARLQGLNAMVANALSPQVMESIELSSIGRLLALTGNTEINMLACVQFEKVFGRSEVYQLATRVKKAPGAAGETDEEVQGRTFAAEDVTYRKLMDRLEDGQQVRTTRLTKDFTYDDWRSAYPDGLPLMVVNDTGGVQVANPEKPVAPKAGSKVIAVVPAEPEREAVATTATEPAPA